MKLEELQFDLYGKVTDFQTTFIKVGDQIEYLSKKHYHSFEVR